jgi:hypothetical protein
MPAKPSELAIRKTQNPRLLMRTSRCAAACFVTQWEALGAYLSTLDWSYFVTLTVDRPLSPESLVLEFKDRFIRRLAKQAMRAVPWFYAIERDSVSNQFPHLHTLISGCSHLPVDVIRKTWTNGYTSASRYDAQRGASYYVPKQILLNDDNYDFSKRSARRTVQKVDRSFAESHVIQSRDFVP